MGFQQHHLVALLLSASAHLGLGFAFGISNGGMESSSVSGSPLSTGILTVHLRNSDSTAMPSSLESVGEDKAVEEPLVFPTSLSPIAQRPIEATPILPIVGPAEPRYFRLSELTQKPLVSLDTSSRLTLVVPGVSSQPAILRLLINDQGDVDRVMVENSDLPAQAEHSIIEAFSKVKFHPGKIGRISVRSQMRIEIILVSDAPDTGLRRKNRGEILPKSDP